MKGKDKCTLLKQIRCTVARANNIDYSPAECTFQGECKGTCPKCEAELRYITSELEKIKSTGKRIAVAGVAAAVIATNVAGCKSMGNSPQDETAVPYNEIQGTEAGSPSQSGGQEQSVVLEGDVAYLPEELPPTQPEDTNEPTDVLPEDESIEVTDEQVEEEIVPDDEVLIETSEGIVVDWELEGDVAYDDEYLTGTGDYVPEDALPDITIPTLQQAVEMTSEQLKPFVVGLNRDDVRKIWGAQAPVQQPSTFENRFDEYWIDLTGIHLYFDSENIITDAEVFIVEDCSSSDVIAP